MPSDTALDSIARGLAQGMSRREALRKGGAAFVAAMALSPSDAWARVTGRCPHHRHRCGSKCCPSGEVCLHPKRRKHAKHAPKPRCGCPANTKRCRGKCVRVRTDVHNCGRCGHKCGPGHICAKGKCVCPPSHNVCSGACVNLASNSKHCGQCGRTCPAGTTCLGGSCVNLCPAGTTECSGSCVNLHSDPGNCGACGAACAAGAVCVNGVCGGGCPAGTTKCNGTCVQTAKDPNNCGGCGRVCPGSQVCVSGACSSTCPSGQTACNRFCIDTQTSPANCGACGHACPAGQVCASGACVAGCPGGTVNCQGACCPGTACCGGSGCQTAHSNGVGENYYDCGALGQPGSPATYSQTMATEAAAAAGSGHPTFTQCQSTGDHVAVLSISSGFAVWSYSGATAGHVHVSSSAPTCPTTADSSWN
jgi:hypothetical protein